MLPFMFSIGKVQQKITSYNSKLWKYGWKKCVSKGKKFLILKKTTIFIVYHTYHFVRQKKYWCHFGNWLPFLYLSALLWKPNNVSFFLFVDNFLLKVWSYFTIFCSSLKYLITVLSSKPKNRKKKNRQWFTTFEHSWGEILSLSSNSQEKICL